MPYSIIDINVMNPLPAVATSDTDDGIAILLRRGTKPIDFWMEKAPANRTFTQEDLAVKIAQKAKVKLLSECLRQELLPPLGPRPVPSLTVAICTKDRPDSLGRCLRSLGELEKVAGDTPRSLEILVIDNAPRDERTRTLVRDFPNVRYLREPKPGLDFARNRALQEAQGDLLAFLDDDVTVDRWWYSGLMEAWVENPDAAAFTGLVLPYELATPAQIIFEQRGGFRRGFDKLRYCGQTLRDNPLYPCGAGIFGAGANMTFRRDVLIKVGGFDEALDTGASLPGGGDLDIFYRVVRAGYALVYEPRYLVFHEHRKDLKGLRRQYWSWGLGFMAFVGKSYRNDLPQRSKFRRLLWWWFKYQLWQLQKSLRGRHTLSPDMILAEVWGGIKGLLGEYSRSSKRVEKIRKQFG